jgi:hypothetical protein
MQDTARHQDIESTERLTALFSKVYPAEDPQWFLNALMERIENHWNAIHTHRMEVAGNGHNQTSRFSFDQRDLLLITYPDIVRSKKATPLASLHGFLHDHLPCTFSFIHLLPFYPYSSDDGFSVIDYLQVDPQLGDWEDIAVLAKDSRLMFDAVVNHISAKSAWFTGYLRGDKEYLDYFIEREPEADYTKVVRPRVSPLFTSYQTSTGDKEVWTTETNIPHADNITYFGDGYHEAQIIYQFALPPLVVHSFLSGEMRTLSGWAEKLDFGTDTSYLNFLASHDGVGIIPATGILAPSELDALVHLAHNRGGYVSYKASPQGGQLPYELNCTYYDLICDPMDPEELNIRKFITSQAILLALRGIPALYYHSLFGSRNFSQGVSTTGMKRTVNRKKFTREEIESLLEPTDARTAIIFNTLKHLIEIRKQHPAFSPHARQCMLDLHPALLSFYRTLENEETILTLANASRQPVTVDIPDVVEFQNLASCVAGQAELHQGATPATVTVPAYGFAWLLLEKDHA